MLLWIGFAVLTAGVIAYLALPLLAPVDASAPPQSADLAVYRDQLRAVDAEREQGLLEPTEAEAARAELARRLLRAADEVDIESGDAEVAGTFRPGQTDGGRSVSVMARALVLSTSVIIPVVAIGIYLWVGSPGMPDLPFAARVAKDNPHRSITDLIGLVETRLRNHPDDAKGWEVLAPVYMKQQRFDDAARAYANSLRLNGESPERIAGFAEALVLANNGLVVPEARKAYERLLILAPNTPEPRFWLALAKEQDGDLSGAIADLDAMLKSAPGDVPWRSLVETKLGEMRAILAGGSPPSAPAPGSTKEAAASASAGSQQTPVPAAPPHQPGPGAAEMAAAAQMTPQERSAFITKMVEGLAARLAENGKDLEGWKRLTRAYMVMGRQEDAVKALADARRAFEADKPALEALDALARDLGIGS